MVERYSLVQWDSLIWWVNNNEFFLVAYALDRRGFTLSDIRPIRLRCSLVYGIRTNGSPSLVFVHMANWNFLCLVVEIHCLLIKHQYRGRNGLMSRWFGM